MTTSDGLIILSGALGATLVLDSFGAPFWLGLAVMASACAVVMTIKPRPTP